MARRQLHGETRAEVVVIGGGYTGLSTTLHLAEQGVAVAVLEAHEPGWGAAGRNGGQVNAGFKHEPDQVEADSGPSSGRGWSSSAPTRPMTFSGSSSGWE